MIILGNAILDARRAAEGCDADPESILRDAVDTKASNDIAKPYLAEVKHRWPWGSPPEDALRRFIVKWINKNVLSVAEVKRIEREFAKEENLEYDDKHPFLMLSSLGLVGWPVDGPAAGGKVQHFVLPGEQDVDELPLDIRWFLVHPVLYAAPFHVRVVPGNVIGPGLPFDDALQREPPEYHPAVLCCGQDDRPLAERLQHDLAMQGVACSVLEEGKPIEAGDLVRTGRFFVLCSVDALEERHVLEAIDQQADLDANRIVALSLDRDWQGAGFSIEMGGRDLKPFLMRPRPIAFERSFQYEDSLRKMLGKLEKRRREGRRR
jgi:hypothetical protein